MGQDPQRRDRPPCHHRRAEPFQRQILRLGEWPVAPFMTGIDNLDADRTVVQPLPPLPAAHPRMPGSLPFVDQAQGAPVLVDEVMSTDFSSRVT